MAFDKFLGMYIWIYFHGSVMGQPIIMMVPVIPCSLRLSIPNQVRNSSSATTSIGYFFKWFYTAHRIKFLPVIGQLTISHLLQDNTPFPASVSVFPHCGWRLIPMEVSFPFSSRTPFALQQLISVSQIAGQ